MFKSYLQGTYLLVTKTGENVQKWTRIFSSRRWVILVARTRRKKREENTVSTFGHFRLWTSFESSPVSVKGRIFTLSGRVFLSNNFWISTKFQFMPAPDSDTSVPREDFNFGFVLSVNLTGQKILIFLIDIISEKLRFPLFNFRKNWTVYFLSLFLREALEQNRNVLFWTFFSYFHSQESDQTSFFVRKF